MAVVGREAVAGNEDEGGGEVRVENGAAFRWSSGGGKVRTGTATVRRSRWCGRSGRGGGDGGARGGGVKLGGGGGNLNRGRARAREEERVAAQG